MSVVDVSRLTERALTPALRLAVAVAVEVDADATTARRSLAGPVVSYVRTQIENGHQVTVLLAEVEPRRRRRQFLPNQRVLVLAAALRSRTDAVVATLSFRLT